MNAAQRNPRRIQLTPAYVLHHQPYRDTSRILEVLTREHGRLSLFAKGVRGPKARLAAHVQPFRLLLVSWSGRGEAPQLTGAESGERETGLPSGALLPGFYLNELVLKLTTRHDPLPPLFDAYRGAIAGLRSDPTPERALRIFEKRLLDATGYGLDFASVEPGEWYLLRPSQGLSRADSDAPGAVSGASLLSLAREELQDRTALEHSRRVLRAAIGELLEGRELASRAVARAVARGEHRP